ncbi:MAG: FecR domain-containing protein [Desulfobacterales bacterium]|nr:FecR domain-containing protein [Desulfobacterales bacterium]
MNSRSSILPIFLALLLCLFACKSRVEEHIAKISAFKGEVIVQSDTRILRVAQSRLALKDGDRIQTKQAEARIIFNDGAVMNIWPFTSIAIQEREEKSVSENLKKIARRITCFIGKLRFKTGTSKTKNYLQTPTAVCGIRGSEGDIAFDNTDTYLKMYTGEAKVVGEVKMEVVKDPGIGAAKKSRVYRSLATAHSIAERAKATGKAADVAKAKVAAVKVAKESAVELQKNPDDVVKKEAKVALNVAAADIAVGEAEVAVAQLVEAGASDADMQTALDAVRESKAKAVKARKAADSLYAGEVLDPEKLDEAIADTGTAAEKAQSAAEEATSIRDKIVPEAVQADAELSGQLYQLEASPSQ